MCRYSTWLVYSYITLCWLCNRNNSVKKLMENFCTRPSHIIFIRKLIIATTKDRDCSYWFHETIDFPSLEPFPMLKVIKALAIYWSPPLMLRGGPPSPSSVRVCSRWTIIFFFRLQLTRAWRFWNQLDMELPKPTLTFELNGVLFNPPYKLH